jgi:hypothetical protein
MIIWWSKHVGVTLSVLVCDIWINVLLQTSALVGPLHTMPIYDLPYHLLAYKNIIRRNWKFFFIIEPTRCINFSNLFWHENIPLLSAQWINSWWWTEELSETCRVSWQNKFVNVAHLVGFIIKIFITMHGHMNVKFEKVFTFLLFLEGVFSFVFIRNCTSLHRAFGFNLCCLTRIIHAVEFDWCGEVWVKWLLGTMISCIPQGMGLTLYY